MDPRQSNINDNTTPTSAEEELFGSAIHVEKIDGKFVLTVLFHGTKSNKNDIKNPQKYFNGELISRLRRNIKGVVNRDFVAVDGVGSGNLDHKTRLVHPGWFPDWMQVLAGRGTWQNVMHVLAVIIGYKDDISKINMAGWSRGGGQEFALAYLLYYAKEHLNDLNYYLNLTPETSLTIEDAEKLKNIPINMFVVDPVVGFGCAAYYNCTVTPNVRFSFILYAKNEKSIGFSAVYPKFMDPTTRRIMLVEPGHHASLPGSQGWRKFATAQIYGEVDFREPGTIVHWLAEQFLIYCGTELIEVTQLSGQQLFEMHEKMADELEKYFELEKESYTTHQQHAGTRKMIAGHNGITNPTMSQLPELKFQCVLGNKMLNPFHEFLLDERNRENPQNFFTEYAFMEIEPVLREIEDRPVADNLTIEEITEIENVLEEGEDQLEANNAPSQIPEGKQEVNEDLSANKKEEPKPVLVPVKATLATTSEPQLQHATVMRFEALSLSPSPSTAVLASPIPEGKQEEDEEEIHDTTTTFTPEDLQIFGTPDASLMFAPAPKSEYEVVGTTSESDTEYSAWELHINNMIAELEAERKNPFLTFFGLRSGIKKDKQEDWRRLLAKVNELDVKDRLGKLKTIASQALGLNKFSKVNDDLSALGHHSSNSITFSKHFTSGSSSRSKALLEAIYYSSPEKYQASLNARQENIETMYQRRIWKFNL